jgi:2-aminoadipate transaminase
MISYDSFLSRRALAMQGSAIRRIGTLSAGIPDMISFAPGYPDPAVTSWADFREIAAGLLSGSDSEVLQYGPTRGHAPLLDAVTSILAERGIRASREELLVTTGSQQALDLAARVLCDPSDVVIVELPTYTGALAAFRDAQAELVGVRQDADGINLEDLEAVVNRERRAGKRVSCLYVVPNFQNPAGLLMGLEKRRGLLEAASRLELLIVEDDPYGALYFDDADAPLTRPIKADDGEGRVLYLSSFSKTLAAGFRVAWIAAPAPLVAKFDVAKQAADLCSGALDQRMVFEAWKRGVLAAGLPRLRAHYRHKRETMERALTATLDGVLSWRTPRGGFFILASLPEDLSGEDLLRPAIAERVVFVAGAPFFVDGRGRNTIRLSFSLPAPDRIVEGVSRLARVIRQALERR